MTNLLVPSDRRRRRLPSPLLSLAILLVASTGAWAGVDRTWTGGASGLWTDPTKWSGGVMPTGLDRAIIPAGSTVTIPTLTGTAAVHRVQAIDYLVVDGTVVLQDYVDLLINLDLVTWASSYSSVNYIDGAGTITTPPNVTGQPVTAQILIQNGTNKTLFNQTMQGVGNLTLNYTNGKPNINNPSQALRIPSNVTIPMNGNLNMILGAIQIGSNPNSGGAILDVRGDIRIGDVNDPTSASFIYFKAAGSNLKCGGNWYQGGSKLKDNTITTTITFSGTTDQTIQVNNIDITSCDYDNLIIAGGNRTVTYLNNPSLAPGYRVNVALTIGNSVTYVIQDGVILIANILFQDGAPVTGSNGTLRFEGSVQVPLATAFTCGVGTVEYAGQSVAQNVTGSAGPYYNLVIDTTGGAAATQQAAAVSVLNTLTIGKKTGSINTAAIFTAAAQNINVGNDFICNGTFNNGGSTVIMTAVKDGTGKIGTDLGTLPFPPTLFFNNLTVSGDIIAPPATGPTAALGVGAGNVNAGTHSYVVTFVDTATLESSPGPGSNIVTTTLANGKVSLSVIPIGPAGTTRRRIYRTVAGNAGSPLFLAEIADNTTTIYADNTADASLGVTPPAPPVGSPAGALTATLENAAGNVNAGTHSYAVSFVDSSGFESFVGPGSNIITADATHGRVDLSAIPVGPAGTVKRRIYRTIAGNAGSSRFLFDVPDNSTTFCIDNVADASLGATAAPTSKITVVTAAWNFAVGNSFLVPRGKLTLAPGITVQALSGMTVGDSALPAGSATDAILELIGNVTLQVGTNQTLQVLAADGAFVAGTLTSAAPTLTRVGGAGTTFATSFQGVLDVTRLNFSGGNFSGFNINTTAAKVKNFRNVNIGAQDASLAGLGPADVTFVAPSLDFDCPGCFFGTLVGGGKNVRAKSSIGATGMRLRFENRGSANTPPSVNGGGGGPGAGDAADDDDDKGAGNDANGVARANNGVIDTNETAGGSIVQWVYAANIDMIGSATSVPMPAFDWNSFTYYSVYVLEKGNGATTFDTIYVTDLNGDLIGYKFSLSNESEHIVGPLWWDSFYSGGAHVVYFGTDQGNVYKLLDSGGSLTVVAGWPVSIGAGNPVTSSVITDGVNLYFGGKKGAAFAVYRIPLLPPVPAVDPVSTPTVSVKTAPAWMTKPVGTRYLFLGGSSHIYRIDMDAWGAVSGDFAAAGDIVAWTNVTFLAGNQTNYVYLGDLSGRMYAIDALNPTWGVARTGFAGGYASGSAIRASIGLDFYGGRLFFGNDGGKLTTIALSGASSQLTLPGAAAIQTTPVFDSGLAYVSSTAGNLFVVDVNRSLGGTDPVGTQAVVMTYNFGTVSPTAQTDLSLDVTTNRIYVATAGGRMYSFPLQADPTPSNP